MAGGTDKRTYSGVTEKIIGFDEVGSGGRIQTDTDMLYMMTTTTRTLCGRYSGTMEMEAAGGDVEEIQGNEVSQRTAKFSKGIQI